MARFLLASIFALGAAAQSVAYTDPNTDIDFMSFFDSKTQTRWSVATPETLDKDLIIQMVAPTTKGWTGFDLGTTMANKLLVVAWPNGDEVMSSFREASGYTSPPVYSGNVTATPIANGTFVNSTHFSYTFVCGGCITGESDSFSNTAKGTAFGWAYSENAPTTPSSASTTLTAHDGGFGAFSVIFANSSSPNYETWASWAEAPAAASTGSNSTSPSSTGSASSNGSLSSAKNVTATVSNATYDYIIAGAGPAGIIVAERLSESGAEVLLIERGGASTYSSGGKAVQSWNDTVTQYDVPAVSQYLLTGANDTSEWCTDTADQAGCLLGGGSEINALNFVRPQERDFDDKWPTGWKWNDVADAAEKLYERNPGTITPSVDGKHYDQAVYEVMSKLFAGNGWTSVDAIAEPNKKHNVYSHPPWSIANGERAGPVKTYLPLAQARSNFHLQLHSTVVRAIRDDSYITGVEVEDATSGARQIINIKTGGKVILAGGVYSTPRILINSGIGPANQIKIVQSGNVQVTLPDESQWINLPVGQGIMDHPKLPILFKTKSSLQALDQDDIMDPSQVDIDLFAKGSGVLTHSSQRLAFYSSVEGSDGTRFVEGTCTSPSNDTVKVQVYLTHGLTSTGEIGVTADGATEYITQPWLNTQADKDAFTSFLDRLLSYTRAPNSTLTLDTSTGISANATGADLLKGVVTGNHYIGSAKMGTDDGRENGTAVVDVNTKVYGTDNLFVVDASMHPDLPTGNTQAIIMVAAEAAAARILKLDTPSRSRVSASAGIALPVATGAPYANTTVSSAAAVTSAPSVTTAAQVYSTSSYNGGAFSSAFGNLTSALPTGVLSATLSTALPTATTAASGNSTLPHKPLPSDLTLADLLAWIEYLYAESAN